MRIKWYYNLRARRRRGSEGTYDVNIWDTRSAFPPDYLLAPMPNDTWGFDYLNLLGRWARIHKILARMK